MKKLIAMLLCVALVASLGINAFAAVVTVKEFKSGELTGNPNSSESINAAMKDMFTKAITPKTGTAALAAQLSAAKKAYTDAVKAYNTLLGNVGKAAKAAQYNAVATYYNAANAILDWEVQMAVYDFTANVMYDAYYAVADAVYADFVNADGTPTYQDAYAYMASAWPQIFGN